MAFTEEDKRCLMDKDNAKAKIAELVKKYKSLDPHKIKAFNEASTKQGFIQPLFEALGWDFEDTDEVSPEEKASSGRVDYAFKLHGVSQFYLEAKPLKSDLTKEDYIKQAVTYAYNKGVTWAVLTSFDKLMIFNAQQKTPFIILAFSDYLTAIDKLLLLSKESLTNGLLNKEAQQYGALPPSLPIEKRLYKQLSQWREELFNQIFRYNEDKSLKIEHVDEVIQKLFNRLIFIRTCEDRGIEEKKLLAILHQYKNNGHKGKLMDQVRALFVEFDGYYDSDLFSKHLLDDPAVYVDNELLEAILIGLYEIPGSMASYNFNDIDADVLGAVYEQYLGHVASVVKVRAKEAQARMDLGISGQETYALTAKKERRKEHGIYYTPKFITDYIVKETVGRYLKENANHPHELKNIKILDPACGSGSFLIRAYDELLRFRAKQLNKEVADLNQWERLPILTNSIFGVDLDKQAIEIASLNLLLRSLAKRETLPPLSDNIKQGNSLISGTEDELKKYFGDSWREKHAFNWKLKFENIMKNGGFDVVIGNPPYVNESRGNKELFRELKNVPYLRNYYEKNMDLFNYFIEVGIDLLRDGGFLGFIIPAYWTDRTGATSLRKKIIKETEIVHLLDLGEYKVFEDAPGQHNNVVVFRKTLQPQVNHIMTYVHVANDSPGKAVGLPPITTPRQMEYDLVNNKLILGKTTLDLVTRITTNQVFYLERQDIMRGVDTSPSTYQGAGVFVLNEKEYINLRDKLTTEQANDFFKPFYGANKIDRYYYGEKNDSWLLYADIRRRTLLGNKRNNYLPIVEHLDKYKQYITSDNKPYGLHRAKNEKTFIEKDKILFVRKSPYPKFVTVLIPYFVDESVYLITWHKRGYDSKYLLAIFNSRLANWWFMKHKKHGKQLQIDKEQILSFPFRSISFTVSTEKKSHDTLVALANSIMMLNKEFQEISKYTPEKKQQLEKEIKATDIKIDNLVYDLYGLTEEERKIVEGELK
jgi:type I restriction-modification system DNA methylase subunit